MSDSLFKGKKKVERNFFFFEVSHKRIENPEELEFEKKMENDDGCV